ncbi:MAG: 5'-methylthioadenosine/S-adenosylhomocysteine nucleosidase [Elusimicrobia bacterium]|nr:5'-methylthioadenosine/S-adenosylhomocysteine nucleosidase [Elusimicrobiota bacterium]
MSSAKSRGIDKPLRVKAPAGIDGFGKILVLVAMDVEKSAILSGFPLKRVRGRMPLGLEVYQLTSGKSTLYLATTGVGIANAAIAASVLSEKLTIEAILLLGVGGAISPALDIGDTVIGTQVVQHDSRYSSSAGTELMAPGELHLSLSPAQRPTPYLTASKTWLHWLTTAMGESRSFQGTVLSGSEFVGDPARKAELSRITADALLVDMEAAGVAQVARRRAIPFGVAKTVSDRLQPNGTIATDYKLFLAKAAEMSRRIFSRLVSDTSR